MTNGLGSTRRDFLSRSLVELSASLALAMALSAAHAQGTVVVYTSADQEYAEVVLKEAEAATGLKVIAVYDAEASKTVGLERRLLAEKLHPKADVFWNSELLRTHRLAAMGLLEAGSKAGSAAAPSRSFGLRVRVLAVHAPSVPESARPKSLLDLANPRFKGKAAMAQPLFGTTSTHFAALLAQIGETKFTAFLQALKRNEVMLLPGNGLAPQRPLARGACGLPRGIILSRHCCALHRLASRISLGRFGSPRLGVGCLGVGNSVCAPGCRVAVGRTEDTGPP